MDFEYPPLPAATKTTGNGRRSESIHQQITEIDERYVVPNGYHDQDNASDGSSRSIYKIISNNGDIVLEYTDPYPSVPRSRPVRYRWKVSSEHLMKNSPYFSALLDPNKFLEGKTFVEKKSEWSRRSKARISNGEAVDDDLPVVKFNIDHPSRKLRIDVIELFLKVLSLDSFGNDDREMALLDENIKHQPVSLVAALIDLADQFNSPRVVQETLKRSAYPFGKSRASLAKFTSSLSKLSEERIRQAIYIAICLDDNVVFQASTHALIILGSVYWVNGPGFPDPGTPRWSYLPNGIEEELYYRRQCVLNTITDLQAHFLRAYGGLEDPLDLKTSVPHSSASSKSRPFQCRLSFSNSRACDAFHLGEITRFFALRTKTIFLGSTLIDPGFDPGPELEIQANDQSKGTNHTSKSSTTGFQVNSASSAVPPGDILAIIASLRQVPDYQIDSNHTGCGIRRRLLPALDCIEGFLCDSRGLLGLVLRVWKSSSRQMNSWMGRSLRRAEAVDLRYSKIVSIRGTPWHSLFPGPPLPPTTWHEDEARLFFTSRKRNWEA
ncbi:hypothetical protein Egran_04394 [Elaphomyces granulatus]|uniref:Uncharacterized protein n=1 Tax=Elaphomyces granulatus TaxID=519963 RepID=A0A232LUL4_9EURO|nr:hypothetical protein Egran_04394 [Elaphomyces granulatus]